MAGLLNAYGYRLAPDRDKHAASCWVLNSCTVKDPSEASFVNLIREGQGRGKPIVVCGCVPQADRKAKYLKGVSVIGVQQIDR
jgi:threonylcarbamoyladenosine tRNA methylthiotransferase CDKAL1